MRLILPPQIQNDQSDPYFFIAFLSSSYVNLWVEKVLENSISGKGVSITIYPSLIENAL